LSTISSSYLPSSLTSYLNGTPTGAQGATSSSTNPQSSGATGTGASAATVNLSDEAKAFLALAGAGANEPAAPFAAVAAKARSWFDERYKALAITSPTPPGKAALDLSPLDRAGLSAVASNAEKLFSDAEQAAAAGEMQKRFDDAMTAHIAIARKSGNYAALYQAAADHLDQAGTNERAGKTWQDDRKAIAEGLAAAKATKGSAPDTDAAKDPIRALLERRTASATAAGANAGAVAANARALLDDQANQALDAGTRLVFDPRKNGQQVDFATFDNRTLAAVALNKDDQFSAEEARAAKTALSERTRDKMMGVLNPSSGSKAGGDINLGLIKTYENMSEEEKSVLGVTDAVTDRLIQNLQTLQSLQSAFAGGGMGGGMLGLSAAMLAYNQASSKENMTAMGLGGLL